MNTKKPKLTQAERAAAYVSKMDASIEGQGGDRQTFCVACKLVEFGLGTTDALSILSEYNNRCDPKWSDADLVRKLKCAYARASPNPDFVESGAPAPVRDFPKIESVSNWPQTNLKLRSQITSGGCGLADLSDLSPVQFDMPSTLHILNLLFPNNPLICVGKTSMEFWTKPISEFGHTVEQMQLIVPSPMSKPLGKIQDPKPGGPTESAHSKDNTGERRFAVVEFDTGSSDEHAALLWHLADYAPFVMAVHSGGKSLHGWFFVAGEPKDRVFRFYRYAVWLGADRATHLKSQFVRMPGGQRKTGVRQPVYYFNPQAIK